MKKIYYILLVILISQGSISAQDNVRKTALDFYPLPMLMGEFGAELDFATSNNTALGIQFAYFNPTFGLSGVIINSKLDDGDKLEINVHAFLPGITYTYYTKPEMEGFYIGGLVRYKHASGTALYEDNNGSVRGQAKTDMSISTINPNVIGGYRWVFDNNFSIRLGAAVGGQINIVDDITYSTVWEENEGDGKKIEEDLQKGLEIQLRSFVKPVTFQLVAGLGFTF